ncbi:MAG: sulfatase-like hydrolase/transferase, partial [Halanaerobiales bacterium]
MSQKPNILFILMDDMGWKDIGCYGSEFYETPNIDKLAQTGMRFTDGYAACPVCSPTRASILTGKYPARVGVTDWIDFGGNTHPCRGKLVDVPYIDHLPLEEKTLAQALKEGGYNTWHVGKWHLGDEPYYPENQGFEVNIGGCEMGSPGKEGYFSPYNIENLENGPEGEYLTDRLTDEVIKLIKNNEGNPFYLNLDYYAVHTPIMGKEEHVKKYQEKKKAMGLDQMKIFEEGDHFPT